MREKVYLETTVISYLTAWRSPQLLMAAHQEATRIWWDEQKNRLPEKAQIDALHIAVATVHGMDYLLTWNCRHIANATFRHRIDTVCESAGYQAPVLCTPLELMEE